MSVFYEIGKSRQEGETDFLGILLGAIRNRGHETQNVLGCDGRYLYVAEMALKIVQDELIVAQRIFFSRSSAGN